MASAAAVPTATMATEAAAMSPGDAVSCEASVSMRKAVTPPAVIEVVMPPTTEPATEVDVGAVIDVRAVANRPVTNGLRAR